MSDVASGGDGGGERDRAGGGSGGGDERGRGSKDGDGEWQQKKKRAPRNRLRERKRESSASNKGTGEVRGPTTTKKVCGDTGLVWCMLCNTRRDHSGKDCPNNRCFNCGDRGHFAPSCTVLFCGFCQTKGHTIDQCTAGDQKFLKGKRPRGPEMVNTEQPKAQAPRLVQSYSQVTTGATPRPKESLGGKVGSFLSEIKSDRLLDDESFEFNFRDLHERRRLVQVRYERDMAELDRQEKELHARKSEAEAMRTAVQQLAEAYAKVQQLTRQSRPSIPETGTPAHTLAREVATQVVSELTPATVTGTSVHTLAREVATQGESKQTPATVAVIERDGIIAQAIGGQYNSFEPAVIGHAVTREIVTGSPRGSQVRSGQTPATDRDDESVLGLCSNMRAAPDQVHLEEAPLGESDQSKLVTKLDDNCGAATRNSEAEQALLESSHNSTNWEEMLVDEEQNLMHIDLSSASSGSEEG